MSEGKQKSIIKITIYLSILENIEPCLLCSIMSYGSGYLSLSSVV